MEVWKDIPGFNGFYQASSLGRIKSMSRTVKTTIKNSTERIIGDKVLKTGKDRGGYEMINICLDGKPKIYKVHRLIALTFIPNPENKPQVNHINNIRDCNLPENLEWSTNAENILHMVRQGRQQRGAAHFRATLTEAEVQLILQKRKETGFGGDKLKKMFFPHLTVGIIRRIVEGINWKHVKPLVNG